MICSLSGKKFIARREACVLVPYEDGKDKDGNITRWSIGFGCKAAVDIGPITIADAWALLDDKLEEFDGYVNRHLGAATVTQQMFDALVSLYFNTGPNGKRALIDLIKFGDIEGAANMILTFNRVGDVPSVGHTKRRNQERAVFLRGQYGDLSEILVWEVDPRAHPKDYKLVPMPE